MYCTHKHTHTHTQRKVYHYKLIPKYIFYNFKSAKSMCCFVA